MVWSSFLLICALILCNWVQILVPQISFTYLEDRFVYVDRYYLLISLIRSYSGLYYRSTPESRRYIRLLDESTPQCTNREIWCRRTNLICLFGSTGINL